MNVDQYRAKQLSAGAQAHGLLSAMLEAGEVPEHQREEARRIVAAWPSKDERAKFVALVQQEAALRG